MNAASTRTAAVARFRTLDLPPRQGTIEAMSRSRWIATAVAVAVTFGASLVSTSGASAVEPRPLPAALGEGWSITANTGVFASARTDFTLTMPANGKFGVDYPSLANFAYADAVLYTADGRRAPATLHGSNYSPCGCVFSTSLELGYETGLPTGDYRLIVTGGYADFTTTLTREFRFSSPALARSPRRIATRSRRR